jgi:hypothetical protein
MTSNEIVNRIPDLIIGMKHFGAQFRRGTFRLLKKSLNSSDMNSEQFMFLYLGTAPLLRHAIATD